MPKSDLEVEDHPPKELDKFTLHQEEDIAKNNTPNHPNGESLNDLPLDTTPSKATNEPCTKKEVRGSKKPNEDTNTKRGTSKYEIKIDAFPQTTRPCPTPVFASSDSNSSPSPMPTDTDCTITTDAYATANVLSKQSFASSIERSFEMLNNLNLSNNDIRDPWGPFFSEAEVYNQEDSQEDIDDLVAFADKYIIKRSDKKNSTAPPK
mmetsp:Transcript_18065/g.39350  ORF Transcript_18065/g.39350 Transcript_18065/m.39350 type:complete len:207 (-) Transcript_18065:515-1135(-)